MDIKATYEVYNALMKLHKKYAGYVGNAACLPALDGDIKRIAERFGSNRFVTSMTAVMRRWLAGEIEGAPANNIVQFYADLWQFHKRYIGMQQDDVFWRMVTDGIRELNDKYGGCRQLQLYALAIADELERST